MTSSLGKGKKRVAQSGQSRHGGNTVVLLQLEAMPRPWVPLK